MGMLGRILCQDHCEPGTEEGHWEGWMEESIFYSSTVDSLVI